MESSRWLLMVALTKFAPSFLENMSGFLCGHLCATALIKLTDDWRDALDKKNNVGVMAIVIFYIQVVNILYTGK